jgi:3-isopropylmalate/(R)-2-methylmalate dehydratase small subunit
VSAGWEARLRGRVWVFPGTVTTDDILPGRYLDHASDEVGAFAMAGLDPTFAARVRAGDLVAGGSNFGRGSGRESAPHALRRAGVAAVIAPSFARVFYRNCINIGLPAIVVDSIDDFATGDVVHVDLEGRAVTNTRTDLVYLARNLTGISLEILRAGGIVPYTLMRRRRGEEPRP